jgi:hypothetical protein
MEKIMQTQKYERGKQIFIDFYIEPLAQAEALQALMLYTAAGALSGLTIETASRLVGKDLIGPGAMMLVGLATGLAVGSYSYNTTYDNTYNTLYNRYYGEDNVGLVGNSGLVEDLV